MNTAWNSRPLAECTVINCSASAPASGLMFAGFERGVRQKSSECCKFPGLSLPFLGDLRSRTVGGNESYGGIGQFAKILEPILAFAFVLVMRYQPAQLNHMVDDLRQR